MQKGKQYKCSHRKKYLYKIDFACTNVVEQQPIKRPVVAIAVSHAHGWTRMKHTLERPMLANTTKTAKLQRFGINLFPLSARRFFSSLMASFCREPQVYCRQKSGRWIVKGWIAAHCAIRLSSTSSSLATAWRRNGRMGEWLRSLGECFLSPAMNSPKLRESKSHTGARSVVQDFFCPMITENYGYQVATFAARTVSGLCAFRVNLTWKN